MIIKLYILVHLLIVILQNTMTINEKKDILTDTRKEKIGLKAVLILLGIYRDLFYGINQALRHLVLI